MNHPRLQPIGFWSYARQDDELSRGKLSSLRSLLQSELQQQYGREEIQIFQDVAAIPPGDEWEASIRTSLGQSAFLIPIVTPNFIQSEWCCREVALFLEREQYLRTLYPELKVHSRRIFPIHYIDIANTKPYDPAILKLLDAIQLFDFRDSRLADYDSIAVRRQLSQLAKPMRALLYMQAEAQPRQGEQAPDRGPAEQPPSPGKRVTDVGTGEAGGGYTPSRRGPRWMALAAAAAMLAAMIVWLAPWHREPVAIPLGATPLARPPTAAAPSDPTRVPDWIVGTWGIDGDCAARVIVRGGEGRLIMAQSGGGQTEQAITSITDGAVTTDQAVYAHAPESGRSPAGWIAVNVFDPRFDDYRLTPCADG